MRVRQLAHLSGGVLAAAMVVIALVMSPAQSATTYTPNGGPNVNFVGSRIAITDIEAQQTFTCSTLTFGGSVSSPGTSRAYGAAGVTLGSLSTSGCSTPIFGAITVTPVGAWAFTVTGDPTGTTWPARITNMKVTVTQPNCTFTISSVLNGRLDDTTGRFTPSAGASGLTIDPGAGAPTGATCTALDYQSGDTIAVGGAWTNTPPSGSTTLKISNP